MYKDGQLTDSDITRNLIDLISGKAPGRENDQEKTYFNAVGLAYVDVAIAHAMYQRAKDAGLGQTLSLQQEMIFEHRNLADVIRM